MSKIAVVGEGQQFPLLPISLLKTIREITRIYHRKNRFKPQKKGAPEWSAFPSHNFKRFFYNE